jgi:hypothetical protein
MTLAHAVEFILQPLLRPLDGKVRNFRLEEPFPVIVDGRTYEIPQGFVTDLASVPGVFESVIDNDDPRILRPSILHDYLYSRGGRLWDIEPPFNRFHCDKILVDAMHPLGADEALRVEVFAAVQLGGRSYFKSQTP